MRSVTLQGYWSQVAPAAARHTISVVKTVTGDTARRQVVDALRAATSAHVYGPAYENLPEPVQRLDGGDHITVLGLDFDVLAVPGHTAGHIAYYCAEFGGHPLLFCGDTLFSAGCGRLFEGTPT